MEAVKASSSGVGLVDHFWNALHGWSWLWRALWCEEWSKEERDSGVLQPESYQSWLVSMPMAWRGSKMARLALETKLILPFLDLEDEDGFVGDTRGAEGGAAERSSTY